MHNILFITQNIIQYIIFYTPHQGGRTTRGKKRKWKKEKEVDQTKKSRF